MAHLIPDFRTGCLKKNDYFLTSNDDAKIAIIYE
jgi:hypothetical protein